MNVSASLQRFTQLGHQFLVEPCHFFNVKSLLVALGLGQPPKVSQQSPFLRGQQPVGEQIVPSLTVFTVNAARCSGLQSKTGGTAISGFLGPH